MRHCAGTLIALAATLFGWPARAVERPFGSSATRTRAVAVFPDVAPGRTPISTFADVAPAARPDPSVELLSTNPYEAQLAAALAARNLYGDDLDNPYSDEVRFGNPYTDELRFANPYSSPRSSAARALSDVRFENPYSSFPARPTRASAPAALRPPPPTQSRVLSPGTLTVEMGRGFSGFVFIDGVGVRPGSELPVLPGAHTVAVYPTGGAPYSLSVTVQPGGAQRVRLGY